MRDPVRRPSGPAPVRPWFKRKRYLIPLVIIAIVTLIAVITSPDAAQKGYDDATTGNGSGKILTPAGACLAFRDIQNGLRPADAELSEQIVAAWSGANITLLNDAAQHILDAMGGQVMIPDDGMDAVRGCASVGVNLAQ